MGGAGVAPDLGTTFVRGEESGWAPTRPGGRPDRIDAWVGYQEYVAGVARDADGALPEWHQLGPDGRPIKFDGHGWSGEPPVETFLEAKHGYRWTNFADPTQPHIQARIDSLVAQLERQLDSMPEGAVLQWHVSDAYGAQGIRDILARAGYTSADVEVVYHPIR